VAAKVTILFDESLQKPASGSQDLLHLDRALDDLARMNPRQAVMVESRFFGGLDIPEIANLLRRIGSDGSERLASGESMAGSRTSANVRADDGWRALAKIQTLFHEVADPTRE